MSEEVSEVKKGAVLAAPEKCTGCGSCVAACPRGAIKMIRDREGFAAPVVDAGLCTGCGICGRHCPELAPEPPDSGAVPTVCAAWHRDPAVRRASSSGGAFSALAETVLERGGVVFGAAFDEHMNLRHIAVEDEAGLRRLRGSKYLQSDMTGCFVPVAEFLDRGKEVLFVGTSCQIAALKMHFGDDRPGLICCDIACHGAASPGFFAEYLRWLEARLKRDGIFDYHFRDKHSGWYDGLRYAFWNGRERRMCGEADCYFHAFNTNMILRNSCYACRHKKLARQADITLGDFWGIGRAGGFGFAAEIPDGISLILVHSEAGARLLKESGARLVQVSRPLEEALAGNRPLLNSVVRPAVRDQIFDVLRDEGFDAVRRRCLKKDLRTRIISFIRERCPRRLVLMLRGRIP